MRLTQLTSALFTYTYTDVYEMIVVTAVPATFKRWAPPPFFFYGCYTAASPRVDSDTDTLRTKMELHYVHNTSMVKNNNIKTISALFLLNWGYFEDPQLIPTQQSYLFV